ncbi:MAG: hypothetical protein U0031_15035 [Thermomicrobiales bacterium]
MRRGSAARVGERPVTTGMEFAPEAGYHPISRSTVASPAATRRLYERTGAQLIAADTEHAFGQDMINETRDFRLRDGE